MSFRRIIKLLYGSTTFSAKANSQQPTADIGPFSYFCVIIVKQRKMQAKQFWTKAYQRNIAKMVGVSCRYVGDRAVAEDLAHEAFLKAIEKSGTYRRLGSFDGWLMRINLNTTMDYLRRQPQFLSMDDDTVGTRFIASESDVVETCHGASLQDEPIPVVETQCIASLQELPYPQQQVKGTESSVSPLPATPQTPASISRHDGRDVTSWRLQKFERNGYYGFQDENGNIVVYPKYTDIRPFDEYRTDWAMVEIFGFKGFVDSAGQEVVHPQYDEIGKFGLYRDGCALVRKGNFYGFIDTTGKEVMPVTLKKNELIP